MNTRPLRTALLAPLLLAAAIPFASAQVVVEGSGGLKTSLDWSAFGPDASPSSRVFAETLKRDLARSGWFTEAAAGRGELTVAGGCRDAGGKLNVECRITERMTQRPRLAKAFAAPSADARRFAHRVADAIVEAIKGRKGFASARLVMVGTRTGKKELYLADSDGQGLIQLTRDNSVSVAPKWGANNQIVYTSFLKGYPDVYLINVLTGNRQRISNFAGLNTGADISPDGREVVLILSKDGNPELYTKSLSNSRLTRITRTRNGSEASPSWSPDGNRIVYVSDSSGRPHLYITGRSEARGKRISSQGTENVSPDWGANGKIAFASRQEGRYQIVVHDPVSGTNTRVPTRDGANYEDPSWAPDGRHIACTRTAQYRSQVYILDTLGDPPLALGSNQGDWHSPSWSP